ALTLNRPGGSMYMVAIGGGRYRLAVIDHATLHDPVDKPATFAELRASALRLAGTDFGMRETRDAWLSRVGNAARQAASYRAGLDVIDDSLAQCGLIANPTREGIALRDRFNAILGSHPSMRRELAVRLSGLAIRYPAPGQVPLAGQRAPDLDLRSAAVRGG